MGRPAVPRRALAEAGGTEVRGTRFSGSGTIELDHVIPGISPGDLSPASRYNAMHCFATGCQNHNWPHNGWNVHVNVIGGTQMNSYANNRNQNSQDIGDWNCNCCEWISCLDQNHCIAGDGEC